ncbi:MAG: hypothetical protein FVQ79_00685 [Planctomycetes bacterium]|nr:hypothetical protein [Planctomycetota bacterium]
MNRIAKQGIEGAQAIREAQATAFRDVIRLITDALRQALSQPDDHYLDVAAIYPDRIVVAQDGRLWSYPYTLTDDNVVQFGTAHEVVLDHKPVGVMREANGAFVEAKDEKGLQWLIRVVSSGLSANKNYYPDSVLREAVPLFNNVRVFAKSDAEHLKGQGKDINKLIGKLSEPKFIEGIKADTGQIQAKLDILKTSDGIAEKIYEAFNRGMSDLFGFSIDATGLSKIMKRGRQSVREAQKFISVSSVDLIIEAGAGGQIINLIEALNEDEDTDMGLRDRMIEAIKKANDGKLPEGLDIEDDEKLETAYREALGSDNGDDNSDAENDNGLDEGAVSKVVDDRIKGLETRTVMREAIAGAKLPDASKKRLRQHFDDLENFTEAQVEEMIKGEREYLASLSQSGRIEGLGEEGFAESVEDRSEKVQKMIDALFDPDDRSVTSLKECYIDITGDKRVGGQLRDCNTSRLREAVGGDFRESLDSTSWAQVLGDSITRRMLADYAVPNSRYDIWRDLANVVPVSDFRSQKRTRVGGYGDLPAVAQGAPYASLTSPTDEEASYAVTKRGGTEDVTLEMIKNDDVGSIQRIPTRLSRSARRTLAKFVLDFLKDNPNIYDGVALFHASHNNLQTAALDAAALEVQRLAMLQQTEMDSADRIGIPPMHLWGSTNLEETMFDLFRRTTNNDTDFIESLQMVVHAVWYWQDANDWCTSADKLDIPTIEVGFLDGQEEPELFVQDNPTVGSLFTNDKITYKIRHIYSGDVMEYRGLTKNVVA